MRELFSYEKASRNCPIPKLMTYSEIGKLAHDNDTFIWLEVKYDPGFVFHVSVYAKCNDWIEFNIPFDTQALDEDEYGKTWRCWTDPPTENKRKLTPWEEDDDEDADRT